MLKLNVGFTKKVGEANYGSRGAAVNLELELDSGLIGDGERLRERIRHLFALAKLSVDDELAGPSPQAQANAPLPNGNGHTNGRRRDNTRRATASQVRALNTIAERLGINLGDKLHAVYGNRDPAELSIVEASQLIDEIKGAGSGSGGRR